MNKLFLLAILTFSTINTCSSQHPNTSVRDSLNSNILQENRPLSIYFPPSYFHKPEQDYPVLYILDGEYNFHYVSGILELQAGISENIPEMILVGISGKGSKTYKKNCKPNIDGVKDSGNADQLLAFFENELIPYIDSNYRTLNYKTLSGHSIGGLFVINAALKKPDLFNNYIAISPALWWEKNAMNDVAKSTYKADSYANTNIYVSLADEKGMGVEKFLKEVGSDFQFKKFKDENHNSVGAPTYKWALLDIYETWRNTKTYFDSAKELEEYEKEVSSFYNLSLPIADGVLYNTVIYILKDNSTELEKVIAIVENSYPSSKPYLLSLLATNSIKTKNYEAAKNILLEGIKEYPDSFELYEKLAEVALKEDDGEAFKKTYQKTIELAKNQKVRQWRVDEIKELSQRFTGE